MKELIDKSAVIAEIERRMQELRPTNTHKMQVGEKMDRDVLMWLNALTWVKKVIDTIELKEVDTWHLQEKENHENNDIYNSNEENLQNAKLFEYIKDGRVIPILADWDELELNKKTNSIKPYIDTDYDNESYNNK